MEEEKCGKIIPLDDECVGLVEQEHNFWTF